MDTPTRAKAPKTFTRESAREGSDGDFEADIKLLFIVFSQVKIGHRHPVTRRFICASATHPLQPNSKVRKVCACSGGAQDGSPTAIEC